MQSTYIHEVRLPAHYHADQQYPVIFALHGMGSDEQDMLRLMEPLQSDFIIVAVRGRSSKAAVMHFFRSRALAIQSVNYMMRPLKDYSN
ncbi:hypothetical protein AB9M62_07670 [Bacillales bacterium AN1005]